MRERLTISNVEKIRQKEGKLYLLICGAFYILSVASKGIFAAEVKYIIEIWGLTQDKAQLANTFYFITYGVFQVLLFVFMDKINIKIYAFITIPISCCITIAMGLANNIETIWVLFALVGVFQSAVYCTCNYFLTKYLPKKLLPSANKLIASGYAVGTAIACVISAFFVGFDLWRVPYFLFGGLFAICTVLLILKTKSISRFTTINRKLDAKQLIVESKSEKKQTLPLEKVNKPIFSLSSRGRKIAFYIVVLLISLVVNGLYYAVMPFITSVLVDEYAFPQDASIYVSTIIPIIIILGPMITINACEKRKDFIKEAIKFVFIILPFPVVIALVYDVNVILYLALIVVYLIFANGIRVILNNVLCFKMREYINVASVSAITNAFAAIAASIWPLIIALVYENSNWEMTYWTVGIMVLIVLVATVIIDLLVRRIYKKDNDGENLEN